MQNAEANPQNSAITVHSFLEDDKGVTWLGSSYGGLFYFDEVNDTIRYLPAGNSNPYSLHYDFDVFCLSKDNEGNVWVGTDKGIGIFNPVYQPFQTVDENNLVRPFSKTEVIQVFETSSGDILVGTWGNGWFIYDKNFILKKHLFYKPSFDRMAQMKNLVWAFSEAEDGKIWIGYQSGLLAVYDTILKTIRYIDEPGFQKKTIRVIMCDASGNLWFGLHSGSLVKLDKKSNGFVFYNNIFPAVAGKPTPISDIVICKNKEIWIATYNQGFYRFDENTGKPAEHYKDSKKGSPFDDNIYSMSLFNDSVIGIATASKGYLLFNYVRKTFTAVALKAGWTSNQVFGVETDEQNNHWIATPDNLYRTNNINKNLISFNDVSGLVNKHFTNKIYKLSGERLVVPTSTGFVYFSPAGVHQKPGAPHVKIVSFKIFDQAVLIDSILNDNKTIALRHDQNFVSIGYSALNIMGKNSTHFFYQMNGVDRNWVKAGFRRVASYTGLKPGHYTFKVKSQQLDGLTSTETATLGIYISAPWWRTWVAFTAYVAVLCIIAYLLYYNRIRFLQDKQQAAIESMVATQEDERKRISRDLHDDIGTKLSALKLYLSSLHDKATESKNKDLISLAESSRQLITEAMQEVRQLLLNLSPTVLEEFGYTTAVEVLVNKINETKQIHFNLVVFGMKHRLQKDYELALYRITQELINNVLKHSEAKHVSLQIGQRDEQLILMIEDDGKGFDVHTHKDGYGLHNLDARTKLMHGTITIDSQPGKGTSALVEIPYNLNKHGQ